MKLQRKISGFFELRSVLSHFLFFRVVRNINVNTNIEVDSSSGVGTKGRPRNQSEGDHRHRKTEKEEDEELINQVKKSETLIR